MYIDIKATLPCRVPTKSHKPDQNAQGKAEHGEMYGLGLQSRINERKEYQVAN